MRLEEPVIPRSKGELNRPVVLNSGSAVEGAIYGSRAIIMDDCSVKGPVYGKQAVEIGNGCIVRTDVISLGTVELNDAVVRNVYAGQLLLKSKAQVRGSIICENDVYLPDTSVVEGSSVSLSGSVRTGKGSKLGGITCNGDVEIGDGTTVTGIVKADGTVSIGHDCEIQGGIITSKPISVPTGTRIGFIVCEQDLDMGDECVVDRIICRGSAMVGNNCRINTVDVQQNLECGAKCELIDVRVGGQAALQSESHGRKIVAMGKASLSEQCDFDQLYSPYDVEVGRRSKIQSLVARNITLGQGAEVGTLRAQGRIVTGDRCKAKSIQGAEDIVVDGALDVDAYSIYSKEGRIEIRGRLTLNRIVVGAENVFRVRKGSLATCLMDAKLYSMITNQPLTMEVSDLQLPA